MRMCLTLSRFRQEPFVQQLCCSSFATATASRPYSGLGTSSRALGWDPGSTGRSAAACRARAGQSMFRVVMRLDHSLWLTTLEVQEEAVLVRG